MVLYDDPPLAQASRLCLPSNNTKFYQFFQSIKILNTAAPMIRFSFNKHLKSQTDIYASIVELRMID